MWMEFQNVLSVLFYRQTLFLVRKPVNSKRNLFIPGSNHFETTGENFNLNTVYTHTHMPHTKHMKSDLTLRIWREYGACNWAVTGFVQIVAPAVMA